MKMSSFERAIRKTAEAARNSGFNFSNNKCAKDFGCREAIAHETMHRINSGMAGCPSYVWWDLGRTNEIGSNPVRIAIGGKITKSLDALKKEGLKSRNNREYLGMLPLEYLPGEDIYFRIIYSDGTVHQRLFDGYTHEAISAMKGTKQDWEGLSDACSRLGEMSHIDHIVYTEEFGYRHRPWWKVAINTVLRFVQFWTDRPWVVATEFKNDKNGIPSEIIGYRFVQAHYLSRGEKP